MLACLRPFSGLVGSVASLNVPPVLPDTSLSMTSADVHVTVMVASSVLLPAAAVGSFELATVAVLSRTMQSCVSEPAVSVLPVTTIVTLAFGARSPSAQVRVELAIEQPAWLTCQEMLPGNGSVSVTLRAMPVPMFETTMSHSAVSPTCRTRAFALFTTVTSGQATATDAVSLAEPSFAESIEPVLSTDPQLAAVVSLTMWTVPLTAVLPAIVPTSHVRTCEPALPVIAHVEPVPVEPAMLQSRPASPGRLSLTTTPVALPAPLLPQVKVNPIWSPALTLASSAVLPIVTAAARTWKHSVVWLVWLAARYLEPSAGVYSTRKQ